MRNLHTPAYRIDKEEVNRYKEFIKFLCGKEYFAALMECIERQELTQEEADNVIIRQYEGLIR